MYSEEAAFTERSVRRNGASEFFTSNDDVFNNTVRIAVNDGKIGRIRPPDIAHIPSRQPLGSPKSSINSVFLYPRNCFAASSPRCFLR